MEGQRWKQWGGGVGPGVLIHSRQTVEFLPRKNGSLQLKLVSCFVLSFLSIQEIKTFPKSCGDPSFLAPPAGHRADLSIEH